MAKKEIVVTQDPEKPVPLEVLAEEIVAISQGIKKLRTGRIKDHTLLLLIQAAAPNIRSGQYGSKAISTKIIKAVLDGIEMLEQTHIRP